MEEQKVERIEEPVRATHSFGSSSESRSSPKDSGQKKSDGFWKVATVVLIVLLAFFAFRGGNPTGGTVIDTINNGNGQPTPPPSKVNFQELIDKDDHFKGDSNAPVTIIEWSDFECPFCGRFYTETLGQIDEKYIKTGKVKLVYKDFPLSFHPQAQKAAEAAECAGDQGKFWEMHDLLFEKGVQGGVASFKQYAQELSLKSAEFDGCLDSGEKAGEVQKDMADGGKGGIQGTPGFLINGQLVSGAQPFVVFQQVIDAELS